MPSLILRRASVSRASGQWQHEDFDVRGAVALAAGQLKAYTPEPMLGRGADLVNAADIALAVKQARGGDLDGER
jgi:hypothetical protein